MKKWLITPALLILVLGSGVSLAAPALAYCSQPIRPFCAEYDSIGNSFINANDCENRIDAHLKKLERYQACLAEMIEESRVETKLYEDLLTRAESE